jgi:hypothetical protein
MFGECGLGSWTAHELRKAGQTEIGVVNGGSFGYVERPRPSWMY